MKSFVAYILLLTFSISFIQVRELFKVPLLIQHFQQHKAKDQSLSSLGYLKLHYLKEPSNDNDDEKDKQLPFKTLTEYPGNLFCLPAQNESIVPVTLSFSDFNSRYLNRGEYGFMSSVFHPPCFCI